MVSGARVVVVLVVMILLVQVASIAVGERVWVLERRECLTVRQILGI